MGIAQRLLSCLIVLYTVFLQSAISADVNCALNTDGCNSCINGTFLTKCAWCAGTKSCLPYNPTTDVRNLANCTGTFYASNCIVSHTLVLIGVGIGVGVLALVITTFMLWCCCCRGREARRRKLAKEEQSYQRQRDAITVKHEASRAERQEKLDSIRQKYGLKKENPYERFE